MKTLIFLFIFASQFVATLSSDDTSELFDCQSSFELGKQDARKVPTCKWFWTGFGLSSAITLGGFLLMANTTSEMEDEVSPIAIAQIAGIGLTIILPLFFSSQPLNLPNESSIDIDCYKKGYARTLKSRNFLSSLGGVAAGCGAVWVLTYAMAMVFMIGAISQL